MLENAHLDCYLFCREPKSYQLQMRFLVPGMAKAQRAVRGQSPFTFRFAQLAARRHNPDQYGKMLAEDLFVGGKSTAILQQARVQSRERGYRLRFRLVLAANAPELHDLHWETLGDPTTGQPLFTDGQIDFSRTFSLTKKAQERPLPPNGLRALTVVADPKGLKPLLPAGDSASLTSTLDGLAVESQQPASLGGIAARAGGGCDLLFLMCRTSMHGGAPCLWLENGQGTLARVRDTALIHVLRQMDEPPRVLVLVAYPSGQAAPDLMLTRLGRRLACAGLPALLVLPGFLDRTGLNTFCRKFFVELQTHGTVDRAVAVARASIADRPGSWLPTLFLRTANSRFWEPKSQPLGRKIGPYRLAEKIGHGGMGAVFLGRREDRELEMDVAVKLVHDRLASPLEWRRFRQERQLLADLKHPHIATLLDAGSTAEGQPYVIMEYIQGRTIDAWSRAHQPSLAVLLRLFRKLISAVGFAHGKGVIHRDIKPGNIMVTQAGEPKLLDFGIAFLMGEKNAALTGPDQVLLTPEYASPEQFKMQSLQPASDIFALGLVLLELLTGLRPSSWGSNPCDAVTKLIALGRALPTGEGSLPPAWTGPAAEAASPGQGTETATALSPVGTTHNLATAALVMESSEPGGVLTGKTGAGPSEGPSEIAALGDRGSAERDRAGSDGKSAAITREPVPEALGHVLRTALAVDPAHRYRETGRLIASLDRVLAVLPNPSPLKEELTKKYDVFLWYHPAHKEPVCRIAEYLRNQGLEVWLDLWEIGPDQDRTQETGAALDASRACLVLLGDPHQTPWDADTITRDRLAFRAGDLAVLPVLLPGCAYPDRASRLPATLRGRVWITFSDGLESKDLERLTLALQNLVLAGDEDLVSTGVCPFRGLEVFREQDRDYFFGREAMAQRMLQVLAVHRFIAVLGPSGSGKSSVVRAGVIPHLRDRGFQISILTPTAHPLEELAFALAELYAKAGRRQPGEFILNRLRASNEALYFMGRELFADGEGEKLCLVIDQFEELFTLAGDNQDRHRFVDLLCHALDQPHEGFALLVTMRSDFLGKTVLFPDFNNYLLDRALQVTPMSREDLLRAVAAPARLAGLRLEHGLLDRILDDVDGAAGELPLLEHALLELYQRREDGVLTWQGYEEIGGIEGALARRAETEYAALDQVGRKTLRKMFTLCLVHPGEGVEDTRRRATRGELLAVGTSPERVNSLLDRWMAARLLTGSGGGRQQEMVDVAHEALIRKWDRIRGWMTEDRETARLLGRLRQAARAWSESRRDSDLLLRGGPLEQMKLLVNRESAHLSSLEKAFVAAGVRQMRRRKNLAVVVGCLGFVLAAVAFGLFFKSSAAQKLALVEKARAQARTREGNFNLAMMFDEKAGRALGENRPQEAWLYVLAALSRELPTGQTLPGPVGRFADPALDAANRLLWTTPVALPVTEVAGHPAGTILAMAGNDHTIRLVDTASGGPAGLLVGHTNHIRTMAFSPSGEWLASAGEDLQPRLWRVSPRSWETHGPEWVLRGHRSSVTDLAFSPDGKLLASCARDGSIIIWETNGGKELRSWSEPRLAAHNLAFSEDGRWLAFGGAEGTFGLLPVRSGERRLFKAPAGVSDLGFVGPELVVACSDGALRFFDPEQGRLLHSRPAHGGGAVSLDFDPQHSRFASLGLDGVVRLWALAESGLSGGAGLRPVAEWEAFRRVFFEQEDGRETDREDIGIVGEVVAGGDDREDEDDQDGDEDDGDKLGSAGPGHGDRAADGNLCFSSRFIVVVRGGQDLQLFDVVSGQAVATPAGHGGDVLAVAFSPKGDVMATSGGDHNLILWDVTQRRMLAVLRGHESEVAGLAFSADGRYLASASSDGSFALWDMPDGQLRARLDAECGEVHGLVFSADGRTLAVAGEDGSIGLWDVADRRPAARLLGHEDAVLGLAISPDGLLLASASADQTLALWDLPNRRLITRLSGHSASVASVAFSPDGRLLASGSDDGSARLWDVAERRPMRSLLGHGADVTFVTFSPDGRTLATTSDDQTVKIWNVADGREVNHLAGHGSAVVGASFSPDGSMLATASEDRTAKLWDVTEPLPPSVLTGHDAAAVALAFSPDGRFVATASEDQTVVLWDVEERALIGTLKGHQSDVSDVAFSPDGRLLASSSDDQTVRLWDVEERRQLALLRGHQSHISCVAFSPDGRLLATGSDDRNAILWNVATRRPVATLSGHEADVVNVVFSPDGTLLATTSDDRSLRLWNVARRVTVAVLSGHSADVCAAAFSPDGRLLASVSVDQSVKIWDVTHQREVATLGGHGKWVLDVAFSPDGRLLATASGDETIRIWTLKRGAEDEVICEPLAVLGGHRGEVYGVAFSPKSGILASVSGDKSLRLWRPGDLHLLPFSARDSGGEQAVRLFNRSLFYFGYRLEGFQMVFEPQFQLASRAGFLFPKTHAYGHLMAERPLNQHLAQWLADGQRADLKARPTQAP